MHKLTPKRTDWVGPQGVRISIRECRTILAAVWMRNASDGGAKCPERGCEES
jgi:hypothetical protein